MYIYHTAVEDMSYMSIMLISVCHCLRLMVLFIEILLIFVVCDVFVSFIFMSYGMLRFSSGFYFFLSSSHSGSILSVFVTNKCTYYLSVRVRTILALGYWILGDIYRYLIVLLLEGIFSFNTQYDTDHTAVGTVHMPVNNYLVPLVTCTLTDAIVCLDTMLICCYLLSTIIVIIIEFLIWYSVVYMSLQINTLLCYTLVSDWY